MAEEKHEASRTLERRHIDTTLFDTLEKQGDQLNRLQVNYGEVETNQKNIFSALNGLSARVERLVEKISTGQKPNYMVVISAFSLLLALVTALGVGFIGLPMQDMKHTMALNSEVKLHMEYMQRDFDRMLAVQEKESDWIFEHNAEDNRFTAEYSAITKDIREHINVLQKGADKQSSYEERLRSLERISFPITSYRNGRPGG